MQAVHKCMTLCVKSQEPIFSYRLKSSCKHKKDCPYMCGSQIVTAKTVTANYDMDLLGVVEDGKDFGACVESLYNCDYSFDLWTGNYEVPAITKHNYVGDMIAFTIKGDDGPHSVYEYYIVTPDFVVNLDTGPTAAKDLVKGQLITVKLGRDAKTFSSIQAAVTKVSTLHYEGDVYEVTVPSGRNTVGMLQ